MCVSIFIVFAYPRNERPHAQSILGWAGKIRVDGATYNWMGADIGPPQNANVTNVQITPTRSIYTMEAGPMNFSITFLSPIEVRASTPMRATRVDMPWHTARRLGQAVTPIHVCVDRGQLTRWRLA